MFFRGGMPDRAPGPLPWIRHWKGPVIPLFLIFDIIVKTYDYKDLFLSWIKKYAIFRKSIDA